MAKCIGIQVVRNFSGICGAVRETHCYLCDDIWNSRDTVDFVLSSIRRSHAGKGNNLPVKLKKKNNNYLAEIFSTGSFGSL